MLCGDVASCPTSHHALQPPYDQKRPALVFFMVPTVFNFVCVHYAALPYMASRPTPRHVRYGQGQTFHVRETMWMAVIDFMA